MPSERMVFPLWKSLHSLNLMLPKEDRKALLLRLFNDDTPLVNLSHRHANGDATKVEIKAEPPVEQEDVGRRNSSSEDEVEPKNKGETLMDATPTEHPVGTIA
jgi:multisite-specific tRNA:(cytosine-C5)-methyltransferase